MRSKGTKGSKGSRFRKLVKARVAKTGESWAAAVRSVRAARETNGSVAPSSSRRRWEAPTRGSGVRSVGGAQGDSRLRSVGGAQGDSRLRARWPGLKAIPGFEAVGAGSRPPRSSIQPQGSRPSRSSIQPRGLKALSGSDSNRGAQGPLGVRPNRGAQSAFEVRSNGRSQGPLGVRSNRGRLKTFRGSIQWQASKRSRGWSPRRDWRHRRGEAIAGAGSSESDRTRSLRALPIGHRSVEELLTLLRTPSTFAVMVGRVRSPASATLLSSRRRPTILPGTRCTTPGPVAPT